MPRIISFAWTTPALIAGQKTVTRRDWSDDYARKFRAGDEVIAYDRSPRVGGQPVARLRLTHDVRRESNIAAPDSDYEAEGFAYLSALPDGKFAGYTREAFAHWRITTGTSQVIRFEVIEVYRQEGQGQP